jgi:hypothetical protein
VVGVFDEPINRKYSSHFLLAITYPKVFKLFSI